MTDVQPAKQYTYVTQPMFTLNALQAKRTARTAIRSLTPVLQVRNHCLPAQSPTL